MNEYEMTKEAVDRLLVCLPCDELDKEKSTCNKCGCSVYFTARLMGEECPDGKWTAKDWTAPVDAQPSA